MSEQEVRAVLDGLARIRVRGQEMARLMTELAETTKSGRKDEYVFVRMSDDGNWLHFNHYHRGTTKDVTRATQALWAEWWDKDMRRCIGESKQFEAAFRGAEQIQEANEGASPNVEAVDTGAGD